MVNKLKPCPFCGGPAELWRAGTHPDRAAWIACMGKCSVLISKEHKTDEEAIAAWNTRADDAALSEAIARAERAEAENDDLKLSVIAFCSPWAVEHAKKLGLHDRHLHPTHYDILARAGARMDDFTRADLTEAT
jgi:Lar family restriction alleviation protein